MLFHAIHSYHTEGMQHQQNQPRARKPVEVRRVDECNTLDDLFRHCLPAFGGAFLRRIYTILDRAVGLGCPLTMSVAGAGAGSRPQPAGVVSLLHNRLGGCLFHTHARCYLAWHPNPSRPPETILPMAAS